MVETGKKLGAKTGEMVDLTFVHGQQRCCAPLHEHPSSFSRHGKALDLERQGMLVRPQRVMRNGTVLFRDQGKYGVEDLDVMHYQPKDARHGEVFPSNRPHVEHQGFWKEGTVLKNRRLVAQFVMTRATSSRCEKALSGARCATRYMLRRRSTRR